ncbi:MAG: transposase [Gemmataceae bacterium]|nr:transposase [Gemmataceae bacterium]
MSTQPGEPSARARLRAVAERLATSLPEAADALPAAEGDVLAHLACPREHWARTRSASPLERPNRELARRNDVVGISPDRDALLRPGTALPVEQHDERPAVGRRHLPQGSTARLPGGVPGATLAELLKEGMAVWDRSRLEADPHHLTGHDHSPGADTPAQTPGPQPRRNHRRAGLLTSAMRFTNVTKPVC